MEGGVGSVEDPGGHHVLHFVQRLRHIFDVCDEDADGFIKVEDFIDLGQQFIQGEEVEKVVRYLDPNELGRINFKDFCHGVLAIRGCNQLLRGVLGVSVVKPPSFPAQYDGYYCQNSHIAHGMYVEEMFSDSELFPDEESITLGQQHVHHESDLDSAIESTPSSEVSDECRSDGKAEDVHQLYHQDERNLVNPSAMLEFSSHSPASVISAEEQFEDYGEGDDVDYIPSSPCPDDESRTNAFSDLGSSVPSSAGQTPRKMRHMYNSELLDMYCTQCCKKITLLNDLEARLKNLKASRHLQMYRLDCERSGRGRSSSVGLYEYNAKTREAELEQEIKRLKLDNQKLRDQNDDLNGQILSLSLYEAKHLFSTQTKAQSLAAEIDSASKDELMEALKEQEEINLRLRQYMDKIILAILDHNPSILEIKH
ncbi:rab11 family-interacting protein 4-like [Mantella aurantiaca]